MSIVTLRKCTKYWKNYKEVDMTQEQELTAMYEYYKALMNNPKVSKENTVFMPDKKEVDEFGNLKNVDNMFYAFMVHLRGYNGFPKVVNDSDYEKYNSTELYHGFLRFHHAASLLSHWNYHYGFGFASGFYATDKKWHASEYTTILGLFENEDKVMKFKLAPCVVASDKEICRYQGYCMRKADDSDLEIEDEYKAKLDALRDFAKTIDDGGKFLNLFFNKSTMAVYLGIDAMVTNVSIKKVKYVTSQNRGNMIIAESEANRFMKKGKKLKNGVLNNVNSEDFSIIIGGENEKL